MNLEVVTIKWPMVNGYLLKSGKSFVLVDSGFSWQRYILQRSLKKAGCVPGNLKLVVITHADFDHSGNCAWLQKVYKVPIALHPAETLVVEKGQMFLNRKDQKGIITRTLVYLLGLLIFKRFKPDIFLSEGEDLSHFDLDARVYHIPGHSSGSIGIMTGEGHFFCGDLLANDGKPKKNNLVDDASEMETSVERLKVLNISTVYPGHGLPFTMVQYSGTK
jgi:hydroxyacylglutathione hydrolase